MAKNKDGGKLFYSNGQSNMKAIGIMTCITV